MVCCYYDYELTAGLWLCREVAPCTVHLDAHTCTVITISSRWGHTDTHMHQKQDTVGQGLRDNSQQGLGDDPGPGQPVGL